ncbi:MAG: queuosine precursor transporter [Lachnospirales bacterium]
MSNEILLFLSLFLAFGLVTLSFKLFGKLGLVASMVLAIISSNIEVLILVDAFKMEQTLGNVIFASTFLVTDIISELYGKKEAKKVVHIGIFIALSFTVVSQYWLLYTPSANDWAFESISSLFSMVPRITLASLSVMAICQRFDVWLYHKIWSFTENKNKDKRSMLWLRNNGSTLVTQAFNAILFTLGAFAFTEGYDGETLKSIMLSSYVIFVITSISDTPFVYLARFIHENRKEAID